MENGNGHLKQPTVEDHWLLDHHIEEILDNFNDAARMRDGGPDGWEPRFEIAARKL